jgi:mannose-6-phosphate isomerase-like protein (cupin superfamily)
MDARRVVTGHDASGKAVFVSDELVEPVTLALLPGSEFHQIWGSDTTASFPDDGSRPSATEYFPPVGGFRFGFFTIPPDGGQGAPADLDVAAALAEFEEKLPGMARHLEPDEPGMHTTATIDYGVVLSGEATLELDDGATVTLRPGDTYVQNGTRHRWSNSGSVPAVLAIALVGAEHGNVDAPH